MRRLVLLLASICVALPLIAALPATVEAGSAGPWYKITSCAAKYAGPINGNAYVCQSATLRRNGYGFDVDKSVVWTENPDAGNTCDHAVWEDPALTDNTWSAEAHQGDAVAVVKRINGPNVDFPSCKVTYPFNAEPGGYLHTTWPILYTQYAVGHGRLNNWGDFHVGVNIHVQITGTWGFSWSCYSPDGADRCNRVEL